MNLVSGGKDSWAFEGSFSVFLGFSNLEEGGEGGEKGEEDRGE